MLSNVEVLAAGTRLEQDTPDGKPMQVTVVTLLVTPDESERLTLASTEGKIQLALRNPLDTESPITSGIKPGMLLGNAQPRPYVVEKARRARPACAGSTAAALRRSHSGRQTHSSRRWIGAHEQ